MRARRIAALATAVLASGSALSLATSMLAARDLARMPAMPGSGIIGGGGYTEDFFDRFWRSLAPESWHAWGDGSGYDTPTRGPAHAVGVLAGEGWYAFAVAGGGLYDIAWVGDATPDAEWIEEWEIRERLAAGETPVVEAPAWIPAEFARACQGFLPGRSAQVGALLCRSEVPDDAWMRASNEGDPPDHDDLGLEHWTATYRLDEVRTFGWPFRAFVVRGAVVETRVYRRVPGFGSEDVSVVRKWCSDGLAVDETAGWAIGHPLSREVEALPAKGLPWRPLWSGLLANAVLLGAPLVAIPMLFAAGIRALRARIRRGRCPACGYLRTGLAPDARCPECGAERSGTLRPCPRADPTN